MCYCWHGMGLQFNIYIGIKWSLPWGYWKCESSLNVPSVLSIQDWNFEFHKSVLLPLGIWSAEDYWIVLEVRKVEINLFSGWAETGRTKMLTPDYCDNHVCNLMVSYEAQEMWYMLMFKNICKARLCNCQSNCS